MTPYQEGKSAQMSGKTRSENPYPLHTDDRISWLLGHVDQEKSQGAIMTTPQPAALPELTDERQLLREIVENHAESLQALGDELRQRGVTQISYYGPQAEVVAKAMQLIDRARAILALRPQAVPMSHHDVVVMQFKLGQKFNDMTIGDLQTVVTAVEAHHNITAQGAQRGEG